MWKGSKSSAALQGCSVKLLCFHCGGSLFLEGANVGGAADSSLINKFATFPRPQTDPNTTGFLSDCHA